MDLPHHQQEVPAVFARILVQLNFPPMFGKPSKEIYDVFPVVLVLRLCRRTSRGAIRDPTLELGEDEDGRVKDGQFGNWSSAEDDKNISVVFRR